jgi:membrane protein
MRPRIGRGYAHAKRVLARTFECWSDHNAPRLGAALAFYSLLSLAPLVIVLIPLTALLVGQPRAESIMLSYASRAVGPIGANALHTLMEAALHRKGGALPRVLAGFTLLFGASSMFVELRSALNQIWQVQPVKKQDMMTGLLKRYLFAVLTVLALNVFLFVSVTVSAVVANMGAFIGRLISIPAGVLELTNILVSFAFTAVLVALAFRFIPDRSIEWPYIWRGAVLTAILQVIGKSLLGFYLGTAGVGSSYGAASSVVAISVWIYYSAQILFIGAEFTNVYANERRPPEFAERKTGSG